MDENGLSRLEGHERSLSEVIGLIQRELCQMNANADELADLELARRGRRTLRTIAEALEMIELRRQLRRVLLSLIHISEPTRPY